MRFRKIAVVFLVLLCVLVAQLVNYNFKHNEYKIKMGVNPNYVSIIGKSFESYNRKTINSWISKIRNAEKVVDKQFEARDAIAGFKIYQETGMVHYLSNIYLEENYVYVSSFYPEDYLVRFEKTDFYKFDRTKENALDCVRYTLNMRLLEIEFK